MLDVYFAMRYLQLRDNVMDDEEDRTTLGMLERLREAGSIGEEDFRALRDGYRLLRAVDHETRLIVGRSATLPDTSQAAFADIARRLGYETEQTLECWLRSRMKEIRTAYERIMRLGVEFIMETSNQCPRCETGRIRGWSELNDEEREVAKRLPASKEYSMEERDARHRWCTRCWYEETGGSRQNLV